MGSINMGNNIDMSEMFVSSLWKGDLAKPFTVMCGLKRGSQLSCVHNHLRLVLRLGFDRWSNMQQHFFLLCFFLCACLQ